MPIVVTGARERCHECVDGIVVPSRYYRDDVGGRWTDGDRLQA